jgi:uncharacterized protein YndB with AHSA1/START domain
VTKESGKTADAGWQVGVSKTVSHPIEKVWAFVSSRAGVEIWLGPGAELPRERGERYETANGTHGEVRSYRSQDRIRLTWRPRDWDHDSTLQLALCASGPRTTVHFHQEWLASAQERAEQRDYWSAVMDRLVTGLGER